MRTIETTVTVTDDQQMAIKLPSDITPGKYRVVVVIDQIPLAINATSSKPPLKLNIWEWKNWVPESNFRREDIYNDHRV